MADIFGVKNNGKNTYTEKYRGETITIEAGQTIKMNRSKAVAFMGSRPNVMKVDGMGQLKPESLKPLELIRHKPVEVELWVSPRNGERYQSEADMLREDAKYSKTLDVVDESVNGHACPICSDTFESALDVLSHVGKEHVNDTSPNTKPSTVTI